MSYQKILHMVTDGATLRSKADSWTAEDGAEAANAIDKQSYPQKTRKEVGLIKEFRCWLPPTPLHALGDGWQLLAPPVAMDDGTFAGYYEWWFYK